MIAAQVIFIICLSLVSVHAFSYVAVPWPPLFGYILQKISLQLILEHYNTLPWVIFNKHKKYAPMMKVISSNTGTRKFLIWPNVIFEIIKKRHQKFLDTSCNDVFIQQALQEDCSGRVSPEDRRGLSRGLKEFFISSLEQKLSPHCPSHHDYWKVNENREKVVPDRAKCVQPD